MMVMTAVLAVLVVLVVLVAALWPMACTAAAVLRY